MKIKIERGLHMTATERKALKFLASEIGSHHSASCRIGRTDYTIYNRGENKFQFIAQKMETLTIGKLPELTTNFFLVEIKKQE